MKRKTPKGLDQTVEGQGKASDVEQAAAAVVAVVMNGQKKDDHCPFSQWGDQTLGDGLIRLVVAEPFLTAAVALLLDGKQWDALRSGRIFQEMHKLLAVKAGRMLKVWETPGTTRTDLAQTVLTKLGELEFFRTFIASRGTPGGFLNGVFDCQLSDAIRSANRIKHRPHLPLYEGAEDSPSLLRLKQGSYQWSIADLREQVMLLPPGNRSAVIRRHPELGLDEHLLERQKGELKLYRQGLALLKQNMARYDRD